MNQFQDVYLPEGVWGIPYHSIPRFSTKIVLVKSGDEARSGNWNMPLREFQMPTANVDWGVMQQVRDHFFIMGGPLCTWPWQDPRDCASQAEVPPDDDQPVSGLDQVIATGDGVTQTFQLIKTYQVGAFSRVRNVYLPVVDSVIVLMNGVLPEDVPAGVPYFGPYSVSVSRPGGVLTFSKPPIAPGAGHPPLVITAGFVFDTEVRWKADDSLQLGIESMDTESAAPLNFVEVRRC